MSKRAASAATALLSHFNLSNCQTLSLSLPLPLSSNTIFLSSKTISSLPKGTSISKIRTSIFSSCCFVEGRSLSSSSSSSSSSTRSRAFIKNRSRTVVSRFSSGCSHFGSKQRRNIITSSPASSLSSSSQPSSSSSSQPLSSIQMQQGRQVLHFESLPSTQDEARKRLVEDDDDKDKKQYIAITTTIQTKGRGTSGRTWIGKEGNTFLTITIPSNDIVIPITLLPLQIGVIIAQHIQDTLQQQNINKNNSNCNSNSNKTSSSSSNVKVKWPNDVLINGKKVAGVLIESQQDTNGNNYFLVGIGINYKYAPHVNTIGPERGRKSTCICDHILPTDDHDGDINDDTNDNNDNNGINQAKDLGAKVANSIWDWVNLQSNWDGAADTVIQNFEYWTDFGQELILRDVPGNEIVVPIGIEKDGRLRVQSRNGGNERLLCADYLL